MAIDYQKLKIIAKPAFLFSLLLLVLVLIPGIGRQVGGAKRWFRFGIISFQPAELAALALIIYVADFLSRKKDQLYDFWNGFLPPMIAMGVSVFLILLQPDLGSAMSLSVVIFIMLFIAGAQWKHLALVTLGMLPLLYILIFTVPYRRARILSFLNPWADAQGSGFQIIQSQIALGSGKLFGLGLGQSKQKLFYLPAAHTDFIFSIIGEELGLLGTLVVVILFLFFILKIVKIIKSTSDKFGYFLAIGILFLITLKAAVNMGVSTGILPTKGLPLPFVSYGGSSLVLDLISVGILLNISRSAE